MINSTTRLGWVAPTSWLAAFAATLLVAPGWGWASHLGLSTLSTGFAVAAVTGTLAAAAVLTLSPSRTNLFVLQAGRRTVASVWLSDHRALGAPLNVWAAGLVPVTALGWLVLRWLG